jgi:hypothetical protein
MTRLHALLAASALALAPIAAAADDRPPTPEERAQIEEVLRAEGFTSWEEIEWDDDGYWEVDDAVAADGQEYDLKLDAEFNIIERDD